MLASAPSFPCLARSQRIVARVYSVVFPLNRVAFPSVPSVLLSSTQRSKSIQPLAMAEGISASHGEDNCIFCKIRDGVIPSTKLFENDHCIAILDAFPVTPGHALLIPKKHYPFIESMPAEEASLLFHYLPRLTKAVRTATGAEGVTVAQNNGSASGQVVFHVHVHVVPRITEDGLIKLAKSGPMMKPEEAAEWKEKITAALS